METVQKRIQCYLSCSWYFDQAYEELAKMLEKSNEFTFDFHTVQAHIARSPSYQGRLRYERIKDKMETCDALLLLGGVYTHYHDWISKEIMACKSEGDKPLIVVLKDHNLHISPVVKRYADRCVPWNAEELFKAFHDLI
ncbi:TIR domain-containing protein [Paenibacillus sp. MWE-103]|uniref:TIR domain-containing protein n=1 Tax=Paenibacillus artemisiicola TaxID=1172618 RepID=A0ABS3WBS0_9BACL|nr:TIR domain-containing protein [Paenibacillus artemisiicola]MBO7745758.1 TIR domain-containing protein [Paenibacillus artemisiicola]